MRWIKPNLRSSLFAWLGVAPGPVTESTLEDRTEEIRLAMQELLGEEGVRRFPHVARRIRYAADIYALWYLRGDLMGVLAGLGSERAARDQIETLTGMFRGLLPRGLNSRPGPLLD